MRCEDTPARLADYLAGTLPDTERGDLERHAETCRACGEELQSTSDTWQRLGMLTTERPDSEAMRRRFEALLDEEIRGASIVPAARAAVGAGGHAPIPGKSGRAWVRRRRV